MNIIPSRSVDGNFSSSTSSYDFSEEGFANSSGSESNSEEVFLKDLGVPMEREHVFFNDPIWTDDQLIEVVKKGDKKFLEFWFRQGFGFNAIMQQEVFLVCCETGNRELLKFLLENKHVSSDPFLAFPTNDDEKKQKLWSNVTGRHDKEMAELLLNSGLSPLLINGTNIALQCALQDKDVEILILLKKKLGSFDLEGIKSKVLRELAKDENIKLLEQLIGKDFDLNRTYPEKELSNIPMMLAIKNSILDEVKSLPLFLFALTSSSGPQKQVIKLLLDNGVKPNQWINGDSAISFAVTLQDVELIKILLAKGAGKDIHVEGDGGDTAMSRALQTKNQKIIDLLENEVFL